MHDHSTANISALSPLERAPSGDHAPALPYLPALDGLRALAVLAVLLYHAGLVWLPGGFLGVEMFFVISGYLITSLLLVEWERNGRIDFAAFWLRRARRLLPALFLLLLFVVGYTELFLRSEVAGLRGDVLSTAAYVNNWYQVFSHKSYFESVGRPSLLRHMWSLAVEEQFYLLWPLAFALLMNRLRPRQVLSLVLAGAGLSMLLMAVLFQPNADPSRVYYGTDTRAAGLLFGVALAFLWRPGCANSPGGGFKFDLIGWCALAVLGACFLFLNEFQPFLYRGGFALTAVATAALMAVAVHPGARVVPRVLACEPLRWIGLRSYGIYLWHFPVFMLTRPQLDVTLDGLPLLLIRFALTLGIANLSYHLLEMPIRKGALGHAWRAWREAQGRARLAWGLRWAGAAALILTAAAATGTVLFMARSPAPPAYLVHAARLPAPAAAVEMTRTSPPPPVVLSPISPTQTLGSKLYVPPATNWQVASPSAPPRAASPTSPTPRRVAFEGVTAIGDSVMEGVSEELRQAFGASTIIDANQGRLPWDTPALVRSLHAQGKIQSVVVLHIGNNGFFSSEMFNEIMAELKGARRVVVVNLKVPRRWESLNNRMLANAVHAYSNAVLVDWHAASGDRPKLFWKDGIHVRAEGARIYADLIAQAVKRS